MLTNEKKSSPKTNWFSSLRRQKKAKTKNLQQSCLDLSSSVWIEDKLKTKSTKSLTSNASLLTANSVSSISCGTSTASLESDNEKILCENCNRLKISGIVISSNMKTPALLSTQLSREIYLQPSESPQPHPDHISDNNVNQTIQYVNKTEHSRTPQQTTVRTTTIITRTTIIKKQFHRSGLIFGDDGEILNNLDTDGRKFLLNQLHNKSFSHNNSNNNLIRQSSQNHPEENTANNLILNLDNNNDDDIGYIDDDSISIYDDVYTPPPLQCSNCKCDVKLQPEFNTSSKKQIKDELCEVVSEMEALDSQDDCKHGGNSKDKQMSIGRKKFNMDPKKGIEYLVENHLLQMDPQNVAYFLYKGEGLNKTAIGDYLGEKNDFNEQVLKAFVELHDFTNLILVQALRQFLWSFRLPGEAQKIDRMMECFAQRYCQLNPDIFTNTDTCYVLSFAIIMLNTSLHNPSVKDKPTVEQFISMNRGINNGGDLPRELLESLYESIRTEPFKIPQDDGNDLMHTFFNPDKEGWLWKQGGRYKSWKRRWFILNDNCLYYFEYTTDKEPRGIIPLENISVREITDRNKPHCFELYACGGADIIKACKTDSEGKVVEGKHTVYRMSAATEEDKQDWIKRLTVSISHNPFYDILVQRKKKALVKS